MRVEGLGGVGGDGEAVVVAVASGEQEPGRRDGRPSAEPPTDCSCDARRPRVVCTAF